MYSYINIICVLLAALCWTSLSQTMRACCLPHEYTFSRTIGGSKTTVHSMSGGDQTLYVFPSRTGYYHFGTCYLYSTGTHCDTYTPCPRPFKCTRGVGRDVGGGNVSYTMGPKTITVTRDSCHLVRATWSSLEVTIENFTPTVNRSLIQAAMARCGLS